MSAEQNKQLARDFLERVNAHDVDGMSDLLTEDFVEHESGPGIPPTREGVLQFFAMSFAAFPDLRYEVQRIIAEDDMVVVHATWTGTHEGDFMGIPATGRKVAVPFVDIVRVEDGKGAEHWGVTDMGAMMMQLGLVPEQAPS